MARVRINPSAIILLLVLLLPMGWFSPVAAAERHMRVALAAETSTPAPGSEVTLAIEMTPQPGWHGYWLNTGDAGAPDRLQWQLPRDARLSPLRYPVPQKLVIAGLMNYVYERPYALLATLRLPASVPAGAKLPISVDIDYLVCSDTLCVPERASLSTSLTIGNGAIDPAVRKRFDGYRAALPQVMDMAARFSTSAGQIHVAVPIAASDKIRGAYFFPAVNGAIDYGAPQSVGIANDDNQLIFNLKQSPQPQALQSLSGVIALERTDGSLGLEINAINGSVPPIDKLLDASNSRFDVQLWLLALAGAVAGGLLLNLMPCVFPILSLKALSLARSGESEQAARSEALAYTAGVVLSCIGLGGAILLLRAGGESIGWAFQLQNPHVTLALMILMVVLTLNLTGLFELPMLGTGAAGKGAAGAFMTGILATLVASPCTGPFMGAALGSAILLPTGPALSIFAGLGLGLALPFLGIGFVPSLRRALPRPGPWMVTLRHILAIPMGLTALWLGWVFFRQSGEKALLIAVVAIVVLCIALWKVGLRQHRGRKTAAALLVAAAAAIAPVALLGMTGTSPSTQSETGDTPFSEAHLAALRAQGRPVFVYFTADWCLTCKVNEKAAIDREVVRNAFTRDNVAVLVGDWTKSDPAITHFLEKQGRNGVPLYLFYPADNGPVRVLPQILTPEMLKTLAI